MKYLLDTNICIGMIRAIAQKSLAKAASLKASDIYISSIVRFELMTGAEKSTHKNREKAKVESFCYEFVPIVFDDLCADEASKIRSELEGRGVKIGPYDTLIAAVARAHGFTVVTQNEHEFKRVPNLCVENWET
jgi:tRNA(fMet)-specific endonuclease VapC